MLIGNSYPARGQGQPKGETTMTTTMTLCHCQRCGMAMLGNLDEVEAAGVALCSICDSPMTGTEEEESPTVYLDTVVGTMSKCLGLPSDMDGADLLRLMKRRAQNEGK